MAIVALDAGRRARGPGPRGPLADRLEAIVLILILITSAGGLGLLFGGSAPAEPLHFLYAVLVLGSFPIANLLSRNATPRSQALVTVVTSLVAIVLVARLFQTG